MKTINKLVIVALIGLFGLSSCEPGIDNLNLEPESTDELFELIKNPTQTFAVPAGGNWTITGSKGTRIHFNPESFKDAVGNYVTTGTIDIELIETPKATDMLLNKTVTMVGSSQLLQSGGSINIKASQGGQELQAGRYGIDFVQSTSSSDDMSIFEGRTDDNTGFTSWLENATNTQQGTRQDSIAFFYRFDSVNNFNWINCDRFYNDPRPKTNLSINVSGATLSATGAITFIVFPEINAISNLYPASLTNFNQFNLGDSYRAPIGIKAHFVTLAKKGDDYYYGDLTNQTISSGFNGNITLNKRTAAEIKNSIINLY